MYLENYVAEGSFFLGVYSLSCVGWYEVAAYYKYPVGVSSSLVAVFRVKVK